jgi:hypothetical protein
MKEKTGATADALDAIKKNDPTIVWAQMTAALTEMKIRLGEALIQVFGPFVGYLKDIVFYMADFAKANPEIVAGLAVFAVVMGVVSIALAVLLAGLALAAQVYLAYTTSALAAAGGTALAGTTFGAAAAAVWAFVVPLLILAVKIIFVIGLIAVIIYFLKKLWDALTGPEAQMVFKWFVWWWEDMWNSCIEAVESFGRWVEDMMTSLVETIQGYWTGFFDWLAEKWDWLTEKASGIGDWIGGAADSIGGIFSATSSGSSSRLARSLAPKVSGGSGSSITNNQNASIVIQQQPGESAAMLAQKVADVLMRRRGMA